MSPDQSPRGKFRLSREHRKRLLAGDYRPLSFARDPECKPGDIYVVSWSQPKAFVDEQGTVVKPPSEPLLWIEVVKVVRHTRGWSVRYTVHDHRDPTRLLRSVPPRFDAAVMRRDMEDPPTAEEIAQAAEESSYTTSPRAALDRQEALSDAELKPYAAQAKERDELRELRRREEWEQRSLSDRLRDLEDVPELRGHMEAIRRRIQAAERRKGKAA